MIRIGANGSKLGARPYHTVSSEDLSLLLGALMSLVCLCVYLDGRAVCRAYVEEILCEKFSKKIKFVNLLWLHVSGSKSGT